MAKPLWKFLYIRNGRGMDRILRTAMMIFLTILGICFVYSSVVMLSSRTVHYDMRDYDMYEDDIAHPDHVHEDAEWIYELEKMFSTVGDVQVYNLKRGTPTTYTCVPMDTKSGVVTICIHNVRYDTDISKSLLEKRRWEREAVSQLQRALELDISLSFIDLGANLGVYTLAAAKLGRTVLAVEPYYPNIFHLHKSIRINHFENNVKVVVNAISNDYGFVRFSHPINNIGKASIIHVDESNVTEADVKNMKVVKAIHLNDLLSVTDFKRAILKIDIQGSEAAAFEYADLLFSALDIEYVFMEWSNLLTSEDKKFVSDFLSSYGYVPKKKLGAVDPLSKDSVTNWSEMIIWVKP